MLGSIRPNILINRCRVALQNKSTLFVRQSRCLAIRNCSTAKPTEPAAANAANAANEKTGYEIDRISADDYDDFDPDTANPQQKVNLC